MSSTSNHGIGELGTKAVKLEQDIIGRCLQESNTLNRRLESEDNRKLGPTDDSSFCSTSSISPAPICRQFWRAGNYDDKLISKPTCQNGKGYLRIHPKFLHSNATSHKWAFGAVAELLDNSIDEIQNGATHVVVDKTSNPRDGTPALLIQDDGGGMDPEAMRRCVSFGFSDKNSKTTIGQYGNGFKTSSMRLGADVIVFSRSTRARKLTQSVGLLSYTFLMQTGQDRIVVPMVDYELDSHTRAWNALHDEQHLNNNLSIFLEWSPFATEAELLKQCDDIGPHGTKIIVYNLWHTDDGKRELDFESDPEDICLSGNYNNSSKTKANEQHLANRLKCSLRAYLSVLYLQFPEQFYIILRGKSVVYHSIANDLKFPEFIQYKPQNVEGSVITTIGFLKEAPAVNIHGFNVYHKNRLILPFWCVVTYSDSRGRGVVGVLEANFIEPTHNKQDFEKTPVFQKLEARLKEMTLEYWDYHCGLLGYQSKLSNKKNPQPVAHQPAPNSKLDPVPGIYRPVMLAKNSSGAIGVKASSAAGVRQEVGAVFNHLPTKSGITFPSMHQNTEGATFKRKRHEQLMEREKANRRPVDIAQGRDVLQHAVDPARKLQDEEAANIIQENQKLRAQCQEYEETDRELNLKWWWRRPSMQGCNPSINMYDRDILEDIRRKLMTFGNDAFDMFREGPFSNFLQFRWEKCTSRAFFALLSHEVDVEGRENELWFRVGEINIRFGAQEFALMTGLEFGDSGFDPTARHEMSEHSCLSYYGGICPSVNDLYRDFSSSEIVLSNSMEDYVKIANLLFAYLMLACLDGKRAVDLWAVVLVEDAEGWRTFPWGSWSYGLLLHQMSRVKREFANPSLRNLLHAYGPVWVLQAWSYEAIPDLGRLCARQVQVEGVIPRCLKWAPFVAARSFHFQDFFDEEHDCCITLTPTELEVVSSYWDSLQQAEDPLRRRFIPFRGLRAAPARPSTSEQTEPSRPSTSSRVEPSRPSTSRRSSSRCSTSQPSTSEVPDTLEIPVRVEYGDIQMMEPRCSGAKRTRRASSAKPHVGSGHRVHFSQPEPTPVRLDDYSIQRVVDRLVEQLADRLIEPLAVRVTERLKTFIRELFDSISCRRSRSPPILSTPISRHDRPTWGVSSEGPTGGGSSAGPTGGGPSAGSPGGDPRQGLETEIARALTPTTP